MNIQKNVLLAKYTTFKTGGPADFFCEIEKKDDLIECFNWIKQKKLNFFCLGGGSNLLINDLGFRGVVIKIRNFETFWNNTKSSSSAGVVLANLINEAKERNLGGMEWSVGIPATLGGAVKNNAGAFGSTMADRVESVEIFDLEKGIFQQIKNSDCDFSYRKSIFKNKPYWVIWRVEINWHETEKEKIKENIFFYLKQRKEKQPLEYPSAGSFFRNPSISKPAGYLIEKTGLKGKKIGGAEVSNKHANFIINTGKAKTEDVIILSSIIKQKVRSKFGVQLYEEVEYVGF